MFHLPFGLTRLDVLRFGLGASVRLLHDVSLCCPDVIMSDSIMSLVISSLFRSTGIKWLLCLFHSVLYNGLLRVFICVNDITVYDHSFELVNVRMLASLILISFHIFIESNPSAILLVFKGPSIYDKKYYRIATRRRNCNIMRTQLILHVKE